LVGSFPAEECHHRELWSQREKQLGEVPWRKEKHLMEMHCRKATREEGGFSAALYC